MAILLEQTIVVAGCGEIGRPLYRLSRGGFADVLAVDPTLPDPGPPKHAVLAVHVAIPGSVPDFERVVAGYLDRYSPEVVLIHSTTQPGTTDSLVEMLGVDRVAHCQVHGKHAGDRMRRDMLFYPKFVATESDVAFGAACRALAPMGHPPKDIRRLDKPLAGELSKLLATSYFGYLVAWAQEVDRLADRAGVSYEELMSFAELETTDFHIRGKFPGVVRGHCVMPNIEILRQSYPSPFWELMYESNRLRMEKSDD